MRRPRMQGRPPHLPASTVIRWSRFRLIWVARILTIRNLHHKGKRTTRRDDFRSRSSNHWQFMEQRTRRAGGEAGGRRTWPFVKRSRRIEEGRTRVPWSMILKSTKARLWICRSAGTHFDVPSPWSARSSFLPSGLPHPVTASHPGPAE